MIQAVIFDVGGVLVQDYNPEKQRYWEERCRIPPGRLAVDFYINPIAHRSMLGLASELEVWDDFQERHNLSLEDVQHLQEDWAKSRKLNLELLTLIGSLRPRIKPGIISDAFPGARQKLQAAFGKQGLNFEAMFDSILFSAEEGVRKTSTEIFQRALERLAVSADQAIFIDDIQSNVKVAEQCGMQAIWFHDIETMDLVAEILRRIQKD